jgi:hypothetical protein
MSWESYGEFYDIIYSKEQVEYQLGGGNKIIISLMEFKVEWVEVVLWLHIQSGASGERNFKCSSRTQYNFTSLLSPDVLSVPSDSPYYLPKALVKSGLYLVFVCHLLKEYFLLCINTDHSAYSISHTFYCIGTICSFSVLILKSGNHFFTQFYMANA